MVEDEKKAVLNQRNWADEEDEGDDEDVAIGGTIAKPAPAQAAATEQAEEGKQASAQDGAS